MNTVDIKGVQKFKTFTVRKDSDKTGDMQTSLSLQLKTMS